MNNKEKLFLVKSAKSPISGKAILALLGGGLGGGLGALMASRNNNLKDMSLAGLTGASLGGLTGYGVGALDEHIQKKQKEWLAEQELEEQTFDTKEEAFEYMKKTDPEMYKRFADANFKYNEKVYS